MNERDELLAQARRGALARGESVWVDARGTSMTPSLRPGDRLRIERVQPEDLRRNDLVLVQRPGGLLVTHRLVRMVGEGAAGTVVTRGDNEVADDPPQPIGVVVGRVVARDRLGAVVEVDGLSWRCGYAAARTIARVRAVARRALRGFFRNGMGADAASSALASACRVDVGTGSLGWAGVSQGEREAVARLIRRHRVGPWLNSRSPGDAPAWVTEMIEREALAWRAACVGRLAGLDDALDAIGETDVIVLKGAAFAQLLYGAPCGRPFNDLDLVVRPECVAECVEALTAAGWVYRPRRRFRWQRVLEEHNLVTGPGESRPRIELHTGLVDKPEYAPALARYPERLWEEVVPATVADRRCMVLGPEATVLHAAIHWHLHGYAGLGWGLDLALAVAGRGGAVSWERVVSLARRWEVSHITWVALALARIEHGADVPADAVAALRPRDPLARWLVGMIARQPAALRGDKRKRIDQALVFTLRDRLWRRVGAALLLPWRVVFWVPEEDSAPD